MEVQKCGDFGIVVLRLIENPVREAPSLDALERSFAGKAFRTGIISRDIRIPFEAISAVEVNTTAKAERGFLAIFSPEAVVLPCVDVAIWIEGGDEYPVELLEELGQRFRFAIGGDKGVSDVVDGTGADPFAGMGAAGDDDGFARFGGFFGIGRMDTDAEGRDVAAFVGETDIDHAHVGGKEGLKEAHPGNYNGERLVILEKDVGLGARGGARGSETWAEGRVVFMGL